MWVLEPDVDVLRWYETEARIQGEISLQGALSLSDVPGLAHSHEPIAYLLAHGARELPQALTRLTPPVLEKMEACIPFYPGFNSLAYLLAMEGLGTFPQRPQFILCETAFFTDMPAEAALLGLPYDYYEKGIQRYGADGLFHACVWQRCKAERPGLQKLVSVHLGNQPNAAAILDGRAVETSAGFSAVAGIPGQFSSGDLDPGIPLLLARSGWDADSIAFLVTAQAGFQMISGTNGALIDLFEAEPLGLTAAMLSASVLKAVGKCLAALDGTDLVVFAGEDTPRWQALTAEAARRLQFAGGPEKDGFPALPLEVTRMEVLTEAEKWTTAS